MNERQEIIKDELIWMMDSLLELNIPNIAESEERAEDVKVDIMEALNVYGALLHQLSDDELIELYHGRLRRQRQRMGQIESVS